MLKMLRKMLRTRLMKVSQDDVAGDSFVAVAVAVMTVMVVEVAAVADNGPPDTAEDCSRGQQSWMTSSSLVQRPAARLEGGCIEVCVCCWCFDGQAA